MKFNFLNLFLLEALIGNVSAKVITKTITQGKSTKTVVEYKNSHQVFTMRPIAGENIDDAYIRCERSSDFLTDLKPICDSNKTCYTYQTYFSDVSSILRPNMSTQVFTGYCGIYTHKENAPTPTDYISTYTFCRPTEFPKTQTYVSSEYLTRVTKTDDSDESQTVDYIYEIKSTLTNIYTTTDCKENLTTPAIISKTKPPKTTTSTTSTTTSTTTTTTIKATSPTERTVIFSGAKRYNDGFSQHVISVPAEVKEIIGSCTINIKTPVVKGLAKREVTVTSPLASATKVIPTITKTFPVKTVKNNTGLYCDDKECFKFFSLYQKSTTNGGYTTYYNCKVLSQAGSKTDYPDNAYDTTTGFCKPTTSTVPYTYYRYDSEETITTLGENDVTTVISRYIYKNDLTSSITTYCQSSTDSIPKTTTKVVPITTTTTTTTTKRLPITTTTTTTTTTKTLPIPNTTTTTTTTTKTLPIPNITTTTTTTTKMLPITTTTTTTTAINTLPTKCPPVTVTITEKSKTTVTEKVTVTVTVKSEETPVNDDRQCARKYAQCGGIGYKGPTCCESGSRCQKMNKYYSQCV